MQKVLQFTREEVVARLEERAAVLIEKNEDELGLIDLVRYEAELTHFIGDVTYFDVFINKQLFSTIKDIHNNILFEVDDYDNSQVDAKKELAALKDKVQNLIG